MSWVVAGTAVVATVGGAMLGKQKAPKAAAAPQVDIAQEMQNALNANTANFDANAALTRRTNTFDQQEAMRLMEMVVPGFSGLTKQYTQLAARDLESERTGGLPTEVRDELLRTAAAQNLGTGAAGQSGNFNVARNLGIGTLDYQNMLRQRSLNTLSTITGLQPRINPMSTRAMMVTPSEAIQAKGFNEQARYNSQQANFNAQAAASNNNRALMASAFQTSVGALGGAFGGMMGGGAGGILSSAGGGTNYANMGGVGNSFASQTSGMFTKNYGW